MDWNNLTIQYDITDEAKNSFVFAKIRRFRTRNMSKAINKVIFILSLPSSSCEPTFICNPSRTSIPSMNFQCNRSNYLMFGITCPKYPISTSISMSMPMSDSPSLKSLPYFTLSFLSF